MTNRIYLTVSGIILTIGGLWALFSPFTASIVVTFYVGAAFAMAGLVHLIHGARNEEDRLWHLVFGAIGLLLGISFFVNPFGGMLSLTVILGALFFGSGLMQMYLAWKRRHENRVLFLALSGIVSMALAVLIAFNIFTASVTLPGVVLGVELISTGIALLTLRPLIRNKTQDGLS